MVHERRSREYGERYPFFACLSSGHFPLPAAHLFYVGRRYRGAQHEKDGKGKQTHTIFSLVFWENMSPAEEGPKILMKIWPRYDVRVLC